MSGEVKKNPIEQEGRGEVTEAIEQTPGSATESEVNDISIATSPEQGVRETIVAASIREQIHAPVQSDVVPSPSQSHIAETAHKLFPGQEDLKKAFVDAATPQDRLKLLIDAGVTKEFRVESAGSYIDAMNEARHDAGTA